LDFAFIFTKLDFENFRVNQLRKNLLMNFKKE
jgi:hypothetical protein